MPQEISASCGNVKSIQLNFGLAHPWADATEYIRLANVGINQIAMDLRGDAFMSEAFLQDMNNQTMSMNPNRHWSLNGWDRTKNSMLRMQNERPEFRDWRLLTVPRPTHVMSGTFWGAQRALDLRQS